MEDMKQESRSKKPYVTPKLTIHGDMVRITQMNMCGDQTDAAFPAGTFLSQMTCTGS